MSRRSDCKRRVIGPGRPVPIGEPSTASTGVISQPVPQKNASEAAKHSLRSTSRSTVPN